MSSDFQSAFYAGMVMHQRFFPQKYKFQYKMFSFLLDIDELKHLNKKLRWFSWNKFNIFSFYNKDHAQRNGSDLRLWLYDILNVYDSHFATKLKSGTKVYLQCMPRVLGYTFNPISVWYCYSEDGVLTWVICEVKNTFGEQHCYVLNSKNLQSCGFLQAEHPKNFHVSPFISMQADYKFAIKSPDQSLSVCINQYQKKDGLNKHLLTAVQNMQKQNLCDKTLLKYFFKLPFLTLKVMYLIHWQALKIWMRGAKFYKKPPPPNSEHS